MAYTVQQEHQILNLIRLRRKELQDDRAALRKADELSDRLRLSLKIYAC